MKHLFNEADANRAAFLETLSGKQAEIIRLFEINGYYSVDLTGEDDATFKAYACEPFRDNLSYDETAPGSGVFEFKYFVAKECPGDWIRNLPDGHFWNAADIILQTITFLREKLYESQARQASIVCRLDDVLFKGLRSYDEPAETAKKAVSHAAAV